MGVDAGLDVVVFYVYEFEWIGAWNRCTILPGC